MSCDQGTSRTSAWSAFLESIRPMDFNCSMASRPMMDSGGSVASRPMISGSTHSSRPMMDSGGSMMDSGGSMASSGSMASGSMDFIWTMMSSSRPMERRAFLGPRHAHTKIPSVSIDANDFQTVLQGQFEQLPGNRPSGEALPAVSQLCLPIDDVVQICDERVRWGVRGASNRRMDKYEGPPVYPFAQPVLFLGNVGKAEQGVSFVLPCLQIQVACDRLRKSDEVESVGSFFDKIIQQLARLKSFDCRTLRPELLNVPGQRSNQFVVFLGDALYDVSGLFVQGHRDRVGSLDYCDYLALAVPTLYLRESDRDLCYVSIHVVAIISDCKFRIVSGVMSGSS